MKKLNKKGMTLIEIIFCFVIVVVIVLSMFKMVNNYKDKEDIESCKNAIITYKNTVSKAIWDDILKHGGIIKYSASESGENYNYTFTFLDNTTATLSILHNVVETTDPDRLNENSSFYIQYNKEKYDFPKMYNVQFNHPKVEELTSSLETSTTKGRLIHIYVGAYNPDLQIGNQYTILDIYTPNMSDYYYALGGY